MKNFTAPKRTDDRHKKKKNNIIVKPIDSISPFRISKKAWPVIICGLYDVNINYSKNFQFSTILYDVTYFGKNVVRNYYNQFSKGVVSDTDTTILVVFGMFKISS